MKRRRITFLLGLALVLALLAALPVAAQSFPNPGSGSTTTELVNKTSNSAQVNLFYYDQSGNMISGPSPTIPGNGSVAIDPASSQLPQGFNGAGVASSNQPLAAVVETSWTGGPGDGYQMGTYTGVSAGSSKICFPSLWKYSVGANGIISSFTVQNTGTSAASVEIEYIGRDGVSQGKRTDTIPVGAQHTYDLATSSTTVPNIPSDWAGSATVTVTNGGTVHGVAVVNWGSTTNAAVGRSATYNAADCSGTTAQSGSATTVLIAPTVFRVKPSGNWTIWSAINVQNLSNTTANVTIELIPRDPNDPSVTISNKQIPPNSTFGINTRNGGNVPASTFDVLDSQELWAGSAKITVDQAAVATVITQWNRGGLIEGGVYAAIPSNGGGNKFFAPNVKRIVPGGTWQKYTAIIVQNLGASNADVTVTFYDRNGNKKLEFANDIIPAGASFGYNTRNGGNKPAGDFNVLGDAFEGHVVVTSNNGQPISVVINNITRSPGSGSGTTNGVPE
ncbi:MAG: hypothetical protein GXP42_01465 [Chloroflexi bacterium]|nr:hypothetical protein [Chloroflexota bacterium]